MKKIILINLICALICFTGCSSAVSNIERSEIIDTTSHKKLDFVCDLEMEDDSLDKYIYKISEECIEEATKQNIAYEIYEYDIIPDDAVKIKKIDETLSTEELFNKLEHYVTSSQHFSVYFEANNIDKCIVRNYKYVYLIVGNEDEYNLLPALRCDIQNYGSVYLYVENGCFLYR